MSVAHPLPPSAAIDEEAEGGWPGEAAARPAFLPSPSVDDETGLGGIPSSPL